MCDCFKAYNEYSFEVSDSYFRSAQANNKSQNHKQKIKRIFY